MNALSNKQWAYLLLRLTLGINFLGHGLVRFPKISEFRIWMSGEFQNSIIPPLVINAFATLLPFIEFAIGFLLIIGLFTRYTLVAGALLMISLIFGSCMIEKWEYTGFQMIYALFFFILLYFQEQNRIIMRYKHKN